MSSVTVEVCTSFGLPGTGAGVGGFEIAGVAVTEVAGVEFMEGL